MPGFDCLWHHKHHKQHQHQLCFQHILLHTST
jgi:hypothetical protein